MAVGKAALAASPPEWWPREAGEVWWPAGALFTQMQAGNARLGCAQPPW